LRWRTVNYSVTESVFSDIQVSEQVSEWTCVADSCDVSYHGTGDCNSRTWRKDGKNVQVL